MSDNSNGNGNNQKNLSCVISEYLEAKKAERLSPNTLADYSFTFKKLRKHFDDDPCLDTITVKDIRGFINGLNDNISKKTVVNIHTALSSLWR